MPRRAYKEIQLQQLRSFCETARLGSLTAAAASLGLSQPTVCEQVHALERAVGEKLVERHAHGCRPTATGRLVAELAGPLVAGMDALKRNIAEALGRVETWLTVATTQRILVDDLPEVILAFEQAHPTVRLRLLEMRVEEVAAAVESGAAELGLTVDRGLLPQRPGLVVEPGYSLELHLVTPSNHPLARKRHIRPADLAGYPLVNAPHSLPDPVLTATLEKLGVFSVQPRRVEGVYTAVVRRYVELGFGIGLVVALPGQTPQPTLHERSMSGHFGKVPVYLLWRKGVLPQEPVGAFAAMVRAMLDGKQKADAGATKERKARP